MIGPQYTAILDQETGPPSATNVVVVVFWYVVIKFSKYQGFFISKPTVIKLRV